ncbi:GNAT family N-acetyltransferase [Actinospica sp.]|jgi:CelD/BcsL family acetyltransferase involved in cellulose biosynthesis|uniref:GNAT family N-acetyltransferase n=1 Tax=Actinospica sp. TaxID=1872142 RepID=UPI002C5367E2|nr:GNAT family N-acetyltransferase [Actinospica sp.]HWG26087.1 GNAT family N-acetyltransferase [Actinospica sp.]
MADVEVVAEHGIGALSTPSWEELTAAEGSVFQTGRFLRAWWLDRSAKNPQSRLVTTKVIEGERVVGICAFELDAHELSFAGGRDVVDYLGPVALPGHEKEVAAALARWMFDELPWSHAHLAGLVHDDAVAQAITDAVTRLAPDAIVEPYDRAPRIEEAPQGYLQLLNSKRRADVLRKRNRLIEVAGDLDVVDSTPETLPEALERLLAWKACSSPATNEFVAEYGPFVRTLASDLAAVDAARVVELHAGGRPVASAIIFRHRNTAYIYNMAYDMTLSAGDQGALAPGVVLVSLLIERSLTSGLRFDFLKGAQDYKLRLGGVPVDLIGITVER